MPRSSGRRERVAEVKEGENKDCCNRYFYGALRGTGCVEKKEKEEKEEIFRDLDFLSHRSFVLFLWNSNFTLPSHTPRRRPDVIHIETLSFRTGPGHPT